MTGSLIKFELRSSIRILGALWAALITASMLLGIEGRVVDDAFQENSSLPLIILGKTLTIAYGLTFAAMIVAVVLLVILRFYKGLLGEEGYLMHTLPVKEWQLIASKGISALIIVAASGIVMALSILFSSGIAGLDLLGMFQAIGDDYGNQSSLILYTIEGIVIGLMMILAQIYKIYAAMALGQLSGKHRVIASIGTYIGISAVLNAILIFLINLTADFLPYEFYTGGASMGQIEAIFGAVFVLVAIEIAIFYIITERMLTLKLNLQ